MTPAIKNKSLNTRFQRNLLDSIANLNYSGTPSNIHNKFHQSRSGRLDEDQSHNRYRKIMYIITISTKFKFVLLFIW